MVHLHKMAYNDQHCNTVLYLVCRLIRRTYHLTAWPTIDISREGGTIVTCVCKEHDSVREGGR
jgi:hypothetical protein